MAAGVEIYQTSEVSYQAIRTTEQAGVSRADVVATGDLDKLKDRFPDAEVFICAALGANECTIVRGEDTCRICED